MNRILLTHARTVLADEVRDDVAVLIEGDSITALDPACSAGAREINLAGRTLMPGLVDLHCDALEKEVEPRPVCTFRWNLLAHKPISATRRRVLPPSIMLCLLPITS